MSNRALLCLAWTAIAATGTAFAQSKPNPMRPDPNMPRPIAARNTVWIEELTWLEVRDAMKAGKKSILIATGGVEQNGPYLAAGKHNYILKVTCEAIARKLGDTLVAPIVAFVPEGNFDPPTDHMLYPSSISVREETYERLLTDIAESFRTHGFEHIFLIGDSGGNTKGMTAVATALTRKWGAGKTRIHHIAAYYDYPGVKKWLETQGIKQTDEGIHDDYAISAQMMAADPNSVRMKERMAAGKFSINGVSLAPPEKTIAMGKRIAEYRAEITAAAIRKARGK
ncbi:MAG: creatininase family protein [Bryobacterales bacterium]|nr:creatininase family protein [Bryobacterales bacterium]